MASTMWPPPLDVVVTCLSLSVSPTTIAVQLLCYFCSLSLIPVLFRSAMSASVGVGFEIFKTKLFYSSVHVFPFPVTVMMRTDVIKNYIPSLLN